MNRVKSTKTSKPTPTRNWPQVGIRPENRQDLERIGNEWRMNLQETIAALIELWDSSTDDAKVTAIRRPVREAQPA